MLKRMKLTLLTLLWIMLSAMPNFVNAQDKIFTEKDAAGANFALYPKSMSQLKWLPNDDRFVWLEDNAILMGDVRNEAVDTLLNLDILNTWLHESAVDSMKRLPFLNWKTTSSAIFQSKSKIYSLDFKNQAVELIVELPEKARNQSWNNGFTAIAYTVDNNLFVYHNKKHIQITDEEEGIVCGQTVHRNEFGINGGIFWSAEGDKLAFYRMDERMVDRYPIVDVSKRIAELKEERYPMAGLTSHEVSLHIYEFESGNTTAIQTEGPVDQFLTSVSWHPDGKSIFIGILNRDQNHLKMMRYDAQSGKETALLFEERNDKYVEPNLPMYFVPNKSDQFVWFSERDGFHHAYLYTTDGKLLKQLTQGDWMITNVLGFDKKGEHLYFASTKESPLERHNYGISLKSGKMTRFGIQKGSHRAQLSPSGNYLLDTYSNTETPAETYLIATKSRYTRLLHQSENPIADYKFGEMELFSLEASDGSALHCRLIKPIDFDPAKKYPVIVYVYGGPHAQLVTESWLGGSNFYLNYLAQLGYAVFTLDNRGSANRGKAFEQQIHRRLGELEREDQMQGIAYLKSLPWIDADRIGVDGWSYGGFMSINLKLNHPETFKVAVAGGPVTDWKYYEIMYGERYMDTPEQNPEGYEQTSLINQASKLEGKLLLIHGDMDPVVVWQHSLRFIQECVKEGKIVDYFVYPGHEHNVRGLDRAHLIKRITHYFNENL